MVTPWRRWWRRGGDDGDSAKDLARSHQIRRDLARSGEISPDPAGSHQIRRDLTNLATNSSEQQKPRIDGGDRTSSARQNPKIRWRLETEKKMREGEVDGSREE
jgi:hypothetical protein